MWEDNATTDPTNRFTEARGGYEREGVINKKLTERIRTEDMIMSRHDKQHLANTGKLKYHYYQ
jgi:hypothetical protein